MNFWLGLAWMASLSAFSASSLAAQSILDIECRNSHEERWYIRHVNDKEAVFFFHWKNRYEDLVTTSYTTSDDLYVYDAVEFSLALRLEAKARLERENEVYKKIRVFRTSGELWMDSEHLGFKNYKKYKCATIQASKMDAELDKALLEFEQAVNEAMQRELEKQQAIKDAQKF